MNLIILKNIVIWILITAKKKHEYLFSWNQSRTDVKNNWQKLEISE